MKPRLCWVGFADLHSLVSCGFAGLVRLLLATYSLDHSLDHPFDHGANAALRTK